MDMRYDYDTNIYYLIGHGWMHGILPYAGLSDLKGPLVFLEHGLGSLLTPGSHGGTMALHACVLGIGMLYGLKTAALFVRRSTAWAITGMFFFYSLQMCAEPAEWTMAWQQVTLYHVLVWSRGRKDCFGNRHLFLAGMGIAVALLTKWNQAAFWLPIIPLMLWCNRAYLFRSGAMAAAGILLPLLPFALYFYWHGALLSLWQEYVQTAWIYGNSAPVASSVLVTKPIWLFGLMLPDLLARALPSWLAAVGGGCLLSFWVLPAWRGRARRGHVATAVLSASLLLGIAVSFRGTLAHLHYAYYFYPYAQLSIVGMALLLRRVAGSEGLRRGARAVGLLFPLLTLGVGLAVPLYVSLFKQSKGITELRRNVQGIAKMLAEARADFIVTDARHLTVIYRQAGKIPPIRHFIPQLIPGGENVFHREVTAYLAACKPEYVVSSTADAPKAEQCMREAGVPYKPIDLQEWGLPQFPATAEYPAPVVYRRGG